jgi:hypothetical protein
MFWLADVPSFNLPSDWSKLESYLESYDAQRETVIKRCRGERCNTGLGRSPALQMLCKTLPKQP